MTLKLTEYNGKETVKRNVIAFDFDRETDILSLIYNDDTQERYLNTGYIKEVQTIDNI